MWRRMTNRAYYKYHGGPMINGDESHPFIPVSSGNGQVRSNMSAAARQFNESPSFQRLVTTTSTSQQATNSNATMGRNRYNNSSTLSRNNNNNNNTNLYATTTMNRVEDYMINTDPYLMYNKGPSAPPTNYAQSNYATANTSSMK